MQRPNLTYSHQRAGPYTAQHPAHAAQFLPPDPQAMLMQRRSHPLSFLIHPLFVLFLALLAVEGVAPKQLKPTFLIGEMGGRIVGGIMHATNEKELDLAEQMPVASAFGERERMRAHYNGLCAAAVYLDVTIAAYCQAMTNAYFGQALPPASAYRDRYRGHLR
ncbi:MAG: hypothetical protein ROR55_17800 [Devosia sp.]